MKLGPHISAVVTGGASGLGEATVRALAAQGVTPDVVDRIAAELMWLCADREELDLRADQARAGWAAQFSAEAMAKGVEAFYAGVLATRKAAR